MKQRPKFRIRFVAVEHPWWVYHDGQKVGETMPLFMGDTRNEAVEYVKDLGGEII